MDAIKFTGIRPVGGKALVGPYRITGVDVVLRLFLNAAVKGEVAQTVDIAQVTQRLARDLKSCEKDSHILENPSITLELIAGKLVESALRSWQVNEAEITVHASFNQANDCCADNENCTGNKNGVCSENGVVNENNASNSLGFELDDIAVTICKQADNLGDPLEPQMTSMVNPAYPDYDLDYDDFDYEDEADAGFVAGNDDKDSNNAEDSAVSKDSDNNGDNADKAEDSADYADSNDANDDGDGEDEEDDDEKYWPELYKSDSYKPYKFGSSEIESDSDLKFDSELDENADSPVSQGVSHNVPQNIRNNFGNKDENSAKRNANNSNSQTTNDSDSKNGLNEIDYRDIRNHMPSMKNLGFVQHGSFLSYDAINDERFEEIFPRYSNTNYDDIDDDGTDKEYKPRVSDYFPMRTVTIVVMRGLAKNKTRLAMYDTMVAFEQSKKIIMRIDGISALYLSTIGSNDEYTAACVVSSNVDEYETIQRVIEVAKAHEPELKTTIVGMRLYSTPPKVTQSVDTSILDPNDASIALLHPSAADLRPWLQIEEDAFLDGNPLGYLIAFTEDSANVGIYSEHWIMGNC